MTKETQWAKYIKIENLASLKESIQQDLMTYLDGLPDEALTGVCQVVVDNFNNYAINKLN